ncbi:uncharacterized protein V6R79_023747 [Siganus canaliculatus]
MSNLNLHDNFIPKDKNIECVTIDIVKDIREWFCWIHSFSTLITNKDVTLNLTVAATIVKHVRKISERTQTLIAQTEYLMRRICARYSVTVQCARAFLKAIRAIVTVFLPRTGQAAISAVWSILADALHIQYGDREVSGSWASPDDFLQQDTEITAEHQ